MNKIILSVASVFITLISLRCGSSDTQKSADKKFADSTVVLPVKDFVFGEERGFKQCHASTLIRLNNGEFLIAWFGGTEEKNNDVGIWVSKGLPGKWTKPVQAAKIRQDAHWNPVLFQSPGGKIFLFFKVGKEIEDWETWLQTSDDDGDTWTAAQELVAGDKGGRGPVKNKPIILSDGSWLAGASHEKNGFHVFVDRSTDTGKTWTASSYLILGDTAIKALIQPTLWESAPGNVHMLIRSGSGSICRSDSKDYGKTWSPVYNTSLPNPNSGIDLTKLPDGTLALAYNPDNKDYGDRGTLLLALSYDNGNTWPVKMTIEDEKPEDEFSYPGVISFGDTIAMSYTWQRKNVAFWMGTKADVEKAAVK